MYIVSKIMLIEIIAITFVTFTIIAIMLQMIVNFFYIFQADTSNF